jgi:hypothetical protein
MSLVTGEDAAMAIATGRCGGMNLVLHEVSEM